MEEKKEQRRSVGGLEHNERSSHDERGVYLKQETKSLCDTYTGEVYTFIKYIYTYIYRWRVLTAEGLLQAPELHGCSVGRESNVVQVG